MLISVSYPNGSRSSGNDISLFAPDPCNSSGFGWQGKRAELSGDRGVEYVCVCVCVCSCGDQIQLRPTVAGQLTVSPKHLHKAQQS